MERILITHTDQPDFPDVDLTEDNAQMLELMLSNYELVMGGHKAAEEASSVMRINHPAVVCGARRIYDDDRRVQAIDHGVAVFEAAHAYVVGKPLTTEAGDVTREYNAAKVGALLVPHDLSDYMDESVEALRHDAPRLAELSRVTSRRFYSNLTEYAVLGTAMARRLAV